MGRCAPESLVSAVEDAVPIWTVRWQQDRFSQGADSVKRLKLKLSEYVFVAQTKSLTYTHSFHSAQRVAADGIGKVCDLCGSEKIKVGYVVRAYERGRSLQLGPEVFLLGGCCAKRLLTPETPRDALKRVVTRDLLAGVDDEVKTADVCTELAELRQRHNHFDFWLLALLEPEKDTAKRKSSSSSTYMPSKRVNLGHRGSRGVSHSHLGEREGEAPGRSGRRTSAEIREKIYNYISAAIDHLPELEGNKDKSARARASLVQHLHEKLDLQKTGRDCSKAAFDAIIKKRREAIWSEDESLELGGEH